MRIRNRLFQQFKSTSSVAVFKAFKQFRNCVVNELRESKKIYYNQYFEENKNSLTMLWEAINVLPTLSLIIMMQSHM